MNATARIAEIGVIPDVDQFVSTEINYVQQDIERVARQLEENEAERKRRQAKLEDMDRLIAAFRSQVQQLEANSARLRGVLFARKRLLTDLERDAL